MNKVLGCLATSGIAIFFFLIPTWLWLAAWYLTTPDGFWQKMLLVGFGLWFLGGLQFMLFIVLVLSLTKIWLD